MNSKIVVIGAGAAGIAAATKLINLGYSNVVILEAENRIGGRINTISFSQNVIDLGAQWCHGEKNNVVYNIASKHNLLDSSGLKYHNFSCIRSNKEVIPEKISERLNGIISNYMENCKNEVKNSNNSLGDHITRNYFLALEGKEYSDINHKIAAEFFEFFKKFENSIEGSDSLFDVSGKGYLQYHECEGDKVLNWKDQGYVTFLKLLMGSTHPNQLGILENRILFNKKVKEINYEQHPIIITCSDNERISADHVICTASLGVLREKHMNLFKPNLPTYKVNAIDSLGFGTVDKIFLEFSKKFWPDDWSGCALLWRENELNEVRKRKDNWIENLFGFFTVDYQPNILCGWITGESGRKMELASDRDVRESCMYLLRKFLDFNVPEPINITRSKWHSNENFRGSYSFRSMKAEQKNCFARDLASPLTNSDDKIIIQFAGEATHDHYYSTVHGAAESGWREAARLSDFHKKNSNEYDILILGAGLAGLGAAYTLKNSILRYKILEAQNYIGGRVLTKPLKKLVEDRNNNQNIHCDEVDIGAQWLHGTQNQLYKLATKYDVIDSKLSEEGLGQYRLEDGKYVFDEFFRLKIEHNIGKILEKCESFIESNEYPTSVGKYLEENFDNYVQTLENNEDRIRALQLLDWHNRFQIIDNSCLALQNLSAKSWGLYSFNGESCQTHINFKSGFSALVEKIVSNEIMDQDKIILNHPVKEIKFLKNSKNMFLVKTKNNREFYAKYVLVTFSIAVLQNYQDTLFDPKLPSKLSNAINSIKMNTINKIFLQFSEAWWGQTEGIQFVFNDSSYKDKKWTRYLSGFDVMNHGPRNTLLGWIGSYGAVEMEKLNDNDIIRDCLEVLTQFTNLKVPTPIKYYISRWGSNDYVAGGYSFISTTCDNISQNVRSILNNSIIKYNSNDMSLLEINLKNLNLYDTAKYKNNEAMLLFAGEACSETYFSTAHGAFLSGMEQCNKILKFSESSFKI